MRKSTVPQAGLVLGLTASILAEPFFPSRFAWFLRVVVAVVVAGATAYLIAHGVNRLSDASSAATAGLVVVIQIAATVGSVVALNTRLDNNLQVLVLAFSPFVMFRLVVATVDLFTGAFTVSLLAGLAGVVVFAAAVPMVSIGYPSLGSWAGIGTGAAIAYFDGVLIGAFLRPMFPRR
jgi:hypothetical protein